MATDVDGGGDERDFQIHGFHAQRKSVEIIGETVHHIGDHHRLCVQADGVFGEIVAVGHDRNAHAENVFDALAQSADIIVGFNQSGDGIQPNRTYGHRAVVQLLFLREEFECVLNAVGRSHHHRGIGIAPFPSTVRNDRPHNESLHHGEQQAEYERQHNSRQRHGDAHDEIECACHHRGEHSTFGQQYVELISVTHHMTVVYAGRMHAERPDQSANRQVYIQVDGEPEPEGIYIDFMPHVDHHGRGDAEHHHIKQRERGIDRKSPIGHARQPMLGRLS